MSEVTLTIAEILEARGINITDFQEKTGLSYGAAHGLATGRSSRVALTTIAAVCDALGVEPGALFKLSRPRPKRRKRQETQP